MSKANDIKSRIQGKNAAAAYLNAGLTTQTDSNDENIDINDDGNIDIDVSVDREIDKVDLDALRKKVKQDTSLKTKARFEDEHRKLTVWVHNNAFEALQLLAANKKGEKTRIVTEALLKYASEYMKK